MDHKAAQNIYSAEAAWYSTPHQLHSSSFPSFFLPFYSEQLICVCECVGRWQLSFLFLKNAFQLQIFQRQVWPKAEQLVGCTYLF